MKKQYIVPATGEFFVRTTGLLTESPGVNGDTPWGDLNWGGTESGENPMYIRTWRNKLWDSDEDELI